jgi:copper(I)-binding protein
MRIDKIVTFTMALTLGAFACAQDYTVGPLHIEHVVARPSFPGQPSGAAYVTIDNTGKSPDKLTSASSSIAKSAQIHTMSMENNVMKMREIDGIELKPGSKTVMQPGHGYHIMLIGLKQPLKVGDKFPLTLNFEKAGKVEVTVVVEEMNAGMKMKDKGHAPHPHPSN